LYTQIRFGYTPLSLYLTAAVIALGGVELLVLKALVAASVGATAVAGTLIIRSLSGGRAARWAFVLLVLAWGIPAPGGLYNPLCTAFLLLTILFALQWERATTPTAGVESNRRALTTAAGLAGVAAGACFLTKYN